MTEQRAPEIVEQMTTEAGRLREQTEAAQQARKTQGPPEIPPAMREFLAKLLDGKLPDPGDLPHLDPQVLTLAKDLAVVHLPEWRNPAGRKLAEPGVVEIKSAVRIAAYFYERGWRWHEECERVRWIPTPGGPPAPYDDGLHITPDESGQWPAPDPETFYDVGDIAVRQEDDGTWSAAHPRGIEYSGAATKSEAYAGIVARLRAKIEEAQQQ
ncbi:hypothetical protein [Nocardia acidivorans]|uniref:hypothetical protein n=1 Tax=Nocardia acidivorans TaxID=404580 RepID=UPI000836111E|nr:hypothetical protein [Nocardia acidivorans]